MPEYFKEMAIEAVRLTPVVLLSILGGAVASLNRPKDEFSWWYMLIGLLTAVFCGLVMHYLLQPTSLHDGIKTAAISISAYASRDVLYLLKIRLLKSIKKGDV